MKTDERNLVGALAQLLVNGAEISEFKTILASIINYSTDFRPELIQLASRWLSANYTQEFPNETFWPDFEQFIQQNIDLGFALIDGKNIDDIPSFYTEINRVYMPHEDWKIGSLDGLDDLLYGGFGKFQSNKNHSMIWKDIAYSKNALGIETTIAYYQGKLGATSPFNQHHFQHKLKELQSGKGQTYFDIVAEIIRSHPKITWIYQQTAIG